MAVPIKLRITQFGHKTKQISIHLPSAYLVCKVEKTCKDGEY